MMKCLNCGEMYLFLKDTRIQIHAGHVDVKL